VLKRFFDSTLSASAFEREAALLAELRHPNVVQLLRVATRPQPCIVVERLVCSLHALLHEGGGSAELRQRMLSGAAATLSICQHICRGMAYLHALEPPVLHRNLKSQNLLVDEAGRVKISDFGWARLLAQDLGRTYFAGWQWVAPEILAGARYSLQSDVYSFAMVAWEALTQAIPFGGKNSVQVALAVLNQKLRPEIPDWCAPALAELLADCWDDDAARRPMFESVLERLADAAPARES
jgi:serine/threonine protein kinase